MAPARNLASLLLASLALGAAASPAMAANTVTIKDWVFNATATNPKTKKTDISLHVDHTTGLSGPLSTSKSQNRPSNPNYVLDFSGSIGSDTFTMSDLTDWSLSMYINKQYGIKYDAFVFKGYSTSLNKAFEIFYTDFGDMNYADTSASNYANINKYLKSTLGDSITTNDSTGLYVTHGSPTPEPQSWMLLISGMFGIGAAIRTRRNRMVLQA